MSLATRRGVGWLRALAPCPVVSLLGAWLLGVGPAGALAPEVGWRLLPGDGNGEEDQQTAARGPVGASRMNSLPGVTSGGAAAADFGSLSARTQTTVDAAENAGESFCFPIPPAFSCSEAESWWSDRLVLHASGLATPGTTGSFTAQVSISGSLAAEKPDVESWQFVVVESDYVMEVSLDGSLIETIFVNCIAIGFPATGLGLACVPAPSQTLWGDNPQQKFPAGPFGSFDLGPYDFVWGQPFELEVRLTAHTSMNSEDQTAGVATANADLENTLSWGGVTTLYEGPGGTGSSILLGSALVDPASGLPWLGAIPVSEPASALLSAAALGTIAGLGAARRRALDATPGARVATARREHRSTPQAGLEQAPGLR